MELRIGKSLMADYFIAGSDSGIGGRRVRSNVPGKDARRGVEPRHAIVRGGENGSLLEVDDAEDNGRQGGKGKDGRSQPDSQAVIVWSVHRNPLPPLNWSNSASNI